MGHFESANLFSGFKNFPVHTQRIEFYFPCPHTSDGIRKLGLHVVPPYCFFFGLIKDWPILLRHRIRKYMDSPSTRHRIHCGFIFLHSGERIPKYADSLPNSLKPCGRKPYPERKSCGFKNIRIRVDGVLYVSSLRW